MLIGGMHTAVVGYRCQNALPWKMVALAGTLLCCAIPFEWTFMDPIGRALSGTLKDAKQKREQQSSNPDTVAMVTRWGRLNMIRALLPLAGALIGVFTLGADG